METQAMCCERFPRHLDRWRNWVRDALTRRSLGKSRHAKHASVEIKLAQKLSDRPRESQRGELGGDEVLAGPGQFLPPGLRAPLPWPA